MTKTIDQMAREAGIEEFRTSRDQQTVKIAVTYYKYGAKAVVHEIENNIFHITFRYGNRLSFIWFRFPNG